MPHKFGKGGMRMNSFKVKFRHADGRLISREYGDASFALKRAYDESKRHAAYVKYRGNVIAVIQRGGWKI